MEQKKILESISTKISQWTTSPEFKHYRATINNLSIRFIKFLRKNKAKEIVERVMEMERGIETMNLFLKSRGNPDLFIMLKPYDDRSKGGQSTSNNYRMTESFIIQEANRYWREKGKSLRMQEMVAYLRNKAIENKLVCPTDKTLRKWLIVAHNKGRLQIPSSARKGGPPIKRNH